MLKTGLKAFRYSFSVSLFAIMGANRVFFHEKNQTPSVSNTHNKSIALYLADITPSYVPVKKIALNSLPELAEQQDTLHSMPDPEIIIASNLEPLDIPLEFVDNPTSAETSETSGPIFKKNNIELADVLYAPNKPLPIPEIKADPVYKPETSIDVKIASAPLYNPETNNVVSIKSPPSSADTKKEIKTELNNSNAELLIARSEVVDSIPLIHTHLNSNTNKVNIGKIDDLQHIAFAENNIPIQSMTKKTPLQEETPSVNKEWVPLENSPWDIAKSTGSKNLFVNKNFNNKNNKEIEDLVPLKNDKKGIMLASETAKNLIIPIPEDILNSDDITPQLAYPETSEDKKKEIDINAKIKEAEAKEKAAVESKKTDALPVLAPIEDETEITTPVTDEAKTDNLDNIDAKVEKDSIMNTISSIFNKTTKTVSDVTDKVIEKAKSHNNALGKKRSKKKENLILPTEIRLSFQPNRAEISGQTLHWIQAFGTKVAQNPGMILELRIDGTSSTKLQQKRLNLIYNILTNKGVDYSMINTVFTSRDPNSFILRALNTKTKKQEVNTQKTDRYIQW